MSTIKSTHSIHIQDIDLCRNVGLGYVEDTVTVNDQTRRRASNGNPGVWYIEYPEAIHIGDVIQGYRVVGIQETEQPSCRTLLLTKPK